MNLVSERAPKKYLFCKKDNEVMRVSGLLFWGNGGFSEPSLTPSYTEKPFPGISRQGIFEAKREVQVNFKLKNNCQNSYFYGSYFFDDMVVYFMQSSMIAV